MQQQHRFKHKQSLEERLIQQATRLRAEAIGRAEQAETGAQMSQWLRPPGLKASA
jgi:hypothetical protein